MIYFFVLIDILINNYTKYTSYFFIVYLYNKSYKYYLLTGLILDLLIFNTFYNTLILSCIYFINKIFKDLNKKNIYNYLFINIFNYIIYILLINFLLFNSLSNTLILLGSNLIVNTFFYLLNYKTCKN